MPSTCRRTRANLAPGLVEIAVRSTGKKERVPAAEAVSRLLQILSERRAAEAAAAP
jgi:hypothetical protein